MGRLHRAITLSAVFTNKELFLKSKAKLEEGDDLIKTVCTHNQALANFGEFGWRSLPGLETWVGKPIVAYFVSRHGFQRRDVVESETGSTVL